ncbi:MAG: hypothetical protein UMU75_11570 [Halomonas sp.]|nr:hypothetical protein [Halomonas sp.]
MDEREKLRKFRELDDAFAQALRELESTSKPADPEPQAEASASNEDAHQPPLQDTHEFERRLRTLMHDFQQSDASVNTLLRTMLELGRIA